MGLLDDAIREHLELKRRHGADPGEIAKLESEAFGPVREAGDFADRAAGTAAPATHEDAGPAHLHEDDYEPYASGDPESYEPEDFDAREAATHLHEPAPEAYEPPVERPRAPAADPLPDAEPLAGEPFAEAPAPPAPTPSAPQPPPAPESDPDPDPAPEDDPQATVAFSLSDDVDAAHPAPATDMPHPPAPAPADRDVVPADEEHDELEETPEFLEETPEHDRLWFEQKPPRDFDF